MKQLTLMIIAPETARADVMLTPERTYYRFATTETEEDGDLKGLANNFDATAHRLLSALAPLEGESPISADELKITIFADNVLHPVAGISNESLKRAIRILCNTDDTFMFLNGFA